MIWVAYGVSGILIGATAFVMDRTEDFLREILLINMPKIGIASDLNMGDSILPRFITFIGIAAFYGLLSGLLTTYYGPGAAGSGVAELIGYLNGVNYPEFLGINTLITKIVGVVLAVSGKLCIGKEGPLAHIGGNIAALTMYMPGFEFMQNDEMKR
jgi:H+/Cl- antiporter ClcA